MKSPAASHLQANTNPSITLLETAMLTLQDGIAVLSRDGVVQYINDAARQICERNYGMPPEVGTCFFDFMKNPVQMERARASFDSALKNESSEKKVHFNIDGADYWFEMGYYPMTSEDGTINHVCAKAKDITEEVRLERKLALQRQTQKNEVIQAALEAQEKERTFISRELHDNVNQVLTTVRLFLDLSLKQTQPDKEVLQKSLEQIDYCINEIRKLSHKLEPYELDDAGRSTLLEKLQALVSSINETKKININFFYHGMNRLRLEPHIQKGIYRVVQEQLTNIIKHADASMVDFFIVGTSVNISMRISDNGCGFDMETIKKGSGINGMARRVQEMNGELQFTTAPGEGCTLNIRVPFLHHSV